MKQQQQCRGVVPAKSVAAEEVLAGRLRDARIRDSGEEA